LADGREVILVSTSSSTTTSAGLVYQDSPIVAAHQHLTITAVQAASVNGNLPETVTVTLGATALAVNQYQGGFALIDSGAGIGQTLKIASNPAALASATGVTIVLEDGPNVALTTSSTVSLVPQHGANVIVAPTTPTNTAVGVAMYPIPPSSFGYWVSRGIVATLSDATAPAAGASVALSTTTSGAAGLAAATGATVIGTSIQAATSAQARGVAVNL
jgi:hypothetical protein